MLRRRLIGISHSKINDVFTTGARRLLQLANDIEDIWLNLVFNKVMKFKHINYTYSHRSIKFLDEDLIAGRVPVRSVRYGSSSQRFDNSNRILVVLRTNIASQQENPGPLDHGQGHGVPNRDLQGDGVVDNDSGPSGAEGEQLQITGSEFTMVLI